VAARPRLELISESALEVKLDGALISGGPARVEFDPTDAVHFRFVLPEVARGRLIVRSTLLPNLPRGHRQYLTLRDEQDRLLGDRMLDSKNDSFEIQLSATAHRLRRGPTSSANSSCWRSTIRTGSPACSSAIAPPVASVRASARS
jgi:hypothetical protein